MVEIRHFRFFEAVQEGLRPSFYYPSPSFVSLESRVGSPESMTF